MSTITTIGSAPIDPTDIGSRAIGDKIAMQLSSIAYCSLKGSVKSTLAKYLPTWQVAWEPIAAINGDWAFIAYNGVQYVLAIRGSIVQLSWGSFDNWIYQDLNIFIQEPWTYTFDTSTKPMISKGSLNGLHNLQKLQDKNGDTILSFLSKNAFPYGKFLCVTGHSLGANLATIAGPWLHYEILKSSYKIPAIFSILTFASPTSWNKAFADQFDSYFTNSWRYYNEIDIVPYSATKIVDLGFLYNSPAPLASTIPSPIPTAKTLSGLFAEIQGAVLASEVYYGSYYTQVNQKRGSIPLNTSRQIFGIDKTKPLLIQWFEEAGHQHDHNNYLNWLGAKPLSCL